MYSSPAVELRAFRGLAANERLPELTDAKATARYDEASTEITAKQVLKCLAYFTRTVQTQDKAKSHTMMYLRTLQLNHYLLYDQLDRQTNSFIIGNTFPQTNVTSAVSCAVLF